MSQTEQKTHPSFLEKYFIAYQKIAYDFFEKLWSNFNPTFGKCLATVLIFMAGISMRGNWFLMASQFLRQFYDYPTEFYNWSWTSYFQYRFKGLPGYLLQSVIQSFVIYFGLCGFLQWYFYVRQRDRPEEWKCQPKRFLSWEDEKHAVILGTCCMVIGSIISGTLSCWTMNGGYTALYYNVDDYGIPYLIFSIPFAYLFTEALFYYYHRSFHIPYIYKNYHKWHHRYKQPTAFSSTAMHPYEFVVLESALVIPMFVVPMHYAVYIVLVLYEYYYSTISHSGVKIESIWPWQPSTMFHDNHHEFFHVNFGLNTKLYDYLHDTLRKDERIYSEKTFFGRGKEWKDATEAEREEFVKEHGE